MSRKHNISYVKQYFEDNGCELLEDEYINSKTKMEYKCSCGNISKINFGNFHYGKRCMVCGGRQKLTTKKFIERAKRVHKNKYDYSKVEYINYSTKVVIICPKHGKFFQDPDHHLRGQDCLKCSNSYSLTTKEFIKKAKNIHGDRYDYSETEYINAVTPLNIICLKHGKFEQIPRTHFGGCGCPECGRIKISQFFKSTTEEFVKKAIRVHGDRYDYSKVKYKKAWQPITIICKKHGEFAQIPNNHLRGYNCAKCVGHHVPTTKEFVKKAEKVHDSRYDYSKTKYIDGRNKIIIICKKHGKYRQLPSSHLRGAGCPFCIKKNEAKVKELLSKYFKKWSIVSHKKIWDKYKNYKHKRYCDFWIFKNEIKIMIEYDGQQHFLPICFNGISLEQAKKNLRATQLKDKLDQKFCDENDIILHRIKYNEDKEASIKKLQSDYNLSII